MNQNKTHPISEEFINSVSEAVIKKIDQCYDDRMRKASAEINIPDMLRAESEELQQMKAETEALRAEIAHWKSKFWKNG